jgi:uncharacterized protein (TIGR02246 family)
MDYELFGVAGFLPFPLFTVVEGMRNHPSEQPDATGTNYLSLLSGSQVTIGLVLRQRFIKSGLATIFSRHGKVGASVTFEEAKIIIHQAKTAWIDGNDQAFAELFTADGKFIVPGDSWQGKQEILDAFQSFKATHVVNAIEISNIILQGNQALVEWSWEEKEIRSGKISKAEDAIAIDFKGNQIKRWREYIDSESCKA